ncbi:PREDICTED: malonyl-CoA-acyl carrier protein transacylase, mitochondrial-like [Populus euphratica]|uniref:Malonyl-CoA-acyl carrier protein transacylase, mitochondrial-like n=1 Tax=Populus euphratica TaxID=75702 RepID=A0AAJ6X2S9_POPEU|nr:PREDICTED: malonyl-CoA-acyl carrier protein transacylase, mitochondrial-like [Populus euphratica]
MPVSFTTTTTLPLILRTLPSSTMASSSLSMPSVSLKTLSFTSSDAFNKGIRGFALKNGNPSRVFMSLSVGSQTQTVVVDDTLFLDYKPTSAFLFPGQGAQAVGMGKEAHSVSAASELYKKATDILGYDLLELCTGGPKEKLDSTVISQPAIYVTSLAAVEVLRARDGGQQIIDSVDVTCGLSLGEYTALAFAGAFSFEDGLKLVKLRGEAMQEAADAAKSAMVSVIGLDSDKVQQLCDAANQEVDEADRVQIANYLCPGNYAVSGGVKGIEAVEAKAKSFKARMTVRLAVAGAFHTSFMEPAVSRLEAALAATEIRQPRIPVISNVDAQPHADPATIKKILARQVTSPVQWETTVKTLLTKGLKKSYELGPGKVIAGIFKRMDKKAEIENISA